MLRKRAIAIIDATSENNSPRDNFRNHCKRSLSIITSSKGSVQRDGKGKFIEVWMDSIDGELLIVESVKVGVEREGDGSDHQLRGKMLARLKLSKSSVRELKGKRKGTPINWTGAPFNLEVGVKADSWAGGWRDLK